MQVGDSLMIHVFDPRVFHSHSHLDVPQPCTASSLSYLPGLLCFATCSTCYIVLLCLSAQSFLAVSTEILLLILLKMDDLSFSTSQKGHETCIYKNYAYTVKRKTDDSVSWRCRDRSCHGRLRTSNNQVLEEFSRHHLPNEAAIVALER